MKKITVLLGILILGMSGLASAATYTFHDDYIQQYWVYTGSSSIPAYWVPLDFPDSLGGTYGASGVFEYDGYVNDVSSFNITLLGHYDNSSSPIDIYLSFDNKATYAKVASYNVPDQGPTSYFNLQLNILTGDLLYKFPASGGTYVDVGNLMGGIDKYDFVGLDSFWVGYGCHFTHDKTEVDVQVSPVPEPSTLLFLGAGLIGVGILARRKFKK